jgi:SAM-dependent methyltransferase
MRKRVGFDFYVDNRQYTEYLKTSGRGDYDKYVATIETLNPTHALDVGCGIGAAVAALRASGRDAFGCDVSGPSLDVARAECGPYFEAMASQSSLPFPDASFDVVGCMNVLEHVADPSALLTEMCRVLSPAGSLVIFSPNMLSLSWPRARGGLRNTWLIRLQNAAYLAGRALPIGRRADREFMLIDNAVDENALEPDEDAICLINIFDLRRAVRRRGMRITSYSATQRVQSHTWLDALYRTPLGYVLGAVCITARRVGYDGREAAQSRERSSPP